MRLASSPRECFGNAALAVLLAVEAAPGKAQPAALLLRPLFEQAVARSMAEYGDRDRHTAQAERDLGQFLQREGDAPGARRALAEAVRIDEKVFGPAASPTLADVADLAAVCPAAEAEPLWRRASAAREPSIAARAFAAQGMLRERQNQAGAAEKYYRRALHEEERASGPESARVAVRLNALARVAGLTEAIALMDRAARINRLRLGPRHPETATVDINLAQMLLKAGRPEEASRLTRDALSVFQEVFGLDNPRTAVAASVHAEALRATGDIAGAERMLRLAMDVDARALGPADPQTVGDTRALAAFLRANGKPKEAAELEMRATGAGRRQDP